jgi:hypothetical protein
VAMDDGHTEAELLTSMGALDRRRCWWAFVASAPQ